MFKDKRSKDNLTIDFDDQLREAIIDVFACLIPNEVSMDDFKHEAAYRYFTELEKILFLDETQGDVWLIYHALSRMAEIKCFDREFQFILDKRSFSKGLEANVLTLVNNNKDVFIPFLNQHGVDTHLDIQKTLEDASDFIYSATLETFEELMDMDYNVNDCLKYMDILREHILTMLSKKSLIVGSQIISGDGVYIAGRYYKGTKDYVEYTKSVSSMISSRFTEYLQTRKNNVSLLDLATLKAFKDDDTTRIDKLFSIGFEPLDEVFAISTGDLITLIGDEGVGKTNSAVHIMMQALTAGHDVLMMTGESAPTKIMNMCISNYIYRMTGYQFTWKEVMNYNNESEEDQRLIELWQADFVEKETMGKLHLIRSLNYEDFDKVVLEYKMKNPNLAFVVIDHTDRLGSTGGLTEDGFLRDKKAKVDYLYKKEIELKQDYNLTFLNLAHSSADAQKAGVKGRDSGVRIGATSSSTTKDADFVFYLAKDPNISDDFVKWSCKKVRDYSDTIKPFILKKHFEVSNLIYDVEYQLAAVADEDVDIDDLY